jgi:UDP-glucose 4-epimerase
VRALVTGANGFLGRHVVAALLRRGHKVRALVRPAAELKSLGWTGAIEVVRADLRATRDLAPAFDGIDVLIHLAAAVTGGEEAQLAAAVVGTERLLEAMSRSSTRRLVLASSFSVYDWSRLRGTLTEAATLEPSPDLYERDGYAIAKVWQERIARRISAELRWDLVVLRPGFLWGRGKEYLACLGQRVGPLHLVFGPFARIPLTHVENCAELFAAAAGDPRAAGQTINVVDGDDVSVWRYMGDHLRHSRTRGVRVPVPYALARACVALVHRASGGIFRGKGRLPSVLIPCRFEARFKPLRYSNRKARELLGWRPRFSYRECLDRTYGNSTARSSLLTGDLTAPPSKDGKAAVVVTTP